LIAASALSVGIGAYQHSTYQHSVRASENWLRLLWISSLVLFVMAVLGIFSIGLFLLPAVILAMVASVTGDIRSGRDDTVTG
jgi:hypothetical protein